MGSGNFKKFYVTLIKNQVHFKITYFELFPLLKKELPRCYIPWIDVLKLRDSQYLLFIYFLFINTF